MTPEHVLITFGCRRLLVEDVTGDGVSRQMLEGQSWVRSLIGCSLMAEGRVPGKECYKRSVDK